MDKCIFSQEKLLGQFVLTGQTQVHLKYATESKLWRLKQGNGWNVNNAVKRGRLEIIAEILLFCDQHKAKTSIMYNTNLNYAQLESHLSCLTSLGMLMHQEGRYLTTAKGYRFLELFAELQAILRDENT
jgi:predicted transcriptional regulator